LLSQLLNLYKKNRTKTPLEDFTTEAFVGLLNIEEDVKVGFLTEFLCLPKGDYQVATQIKYSLKDDIDCVVDVVIKSESLVCFIENKVNSKEGYRQLERYGKVLSTFAEDDIETKLYYCTKYFDDKIYHNHNFQQIRWFQVAKFLKQFREVTLANEFIDFLTQQDMSQELTLSAKDFLALENLQNILRVTNNYLDRVKPIFENTFQSEIKISDGRTTPQILNYNRLIYLFKNIMGDGGWSEIKYGFQLKGPLIYVGIWIDKSNSEFEFFSESLDTLPVDFLVFKKKNGIGIELRKEISVLLNDDEADLKIKNWYHDSFNRFAKFIEDNPTIDWKIKVA